MGSVPRVRAVPWLLVAALLGLSLLASPAAASADISVVGYTTSDGSFSPTSDGGSIPLGATLEIRVWVDLYSCDPVTVDWGDGITSYRSYGGSFALNWYHTYNATGTYTIQATEACASSWSSAQITVGGTGLAIFDPTNAYFAPSFLGLVFGLAAMGSAFGKPRIPASRAAPPPKPQLVPGAPPSMATWHVSYRDVPVGAPRQNPPSIPIVPLQQTNVFDPVHCPACGGNLGFVAEGWFCLNPGCPLIHKDDRIVHGL